MPSDQSSTRNDSGPGIGERSTSTAERGPPTGERGPSTADRRSSTRRRVLRAFGAVGSVAVAGCSNPTQSSGRAPDWRRTISNASAASPLAVAHDRVFLGTQNKRLHAFDASSGKRAFSYETGGAIEARPVASGSEALVHVRSTDGDVYAIDASGDRLWSHEGVSHRGELAISGSLLVESDLWNGDPGVRGFDAATGEVRFTLSRSRYGFSGLTPAGFAVPAPSEGDRFRVAVLSLADGSRRWETDHFPSYVGVVADEELVVAHHGDTVAAYAMQDGTRQWQQRLQEERTAGGPDLGTHVYLAYEADDREGILALDRATGAVRWREPAGLRVRRIESIEDAVFVGSHVDDPEGGARARLDSFEPDGTRRWKTVTSAVNVEDVAVLEDTVVLASERSLVALDRSSGATRWTHEPDSGSRLDVAAAANSVYVSYLDDGAVAKFPP